MTGAAAGAAPAVAFGAGLGTGAVFGTDAFGAAFVLAGAFFSFGGGAALLLDFGFGGLGSSSSSKDDESERSSEKASSSDSSEEPFFFPGIRKCQTLRRPLKSSTDFSKKEDFHKKCEVKIYRQGALASCHSSSP